MANIIEEYLVRLGFSFDSASINTALTNINNAKNKANSSVSAIAKTVGASFTAISTSIAGANIALGKFVSNMARAELETEVSANKMYMNADAYDQVNQAAKALGYTMDDLAGIALTPELTEQFKTLVNDMQSVGDQTHYRDNMREIRSVLFEFTRLKLTVQMGMRQVVTDLIDIIGGDLERVRRTLQGFVNHIQDELPKISKRIAELLTWVVRAGNMLLNVIKFVGQLSGKVFDFLKQFPGAVKVAGLALVGIFAALNPTLTAAIAGVGGLMMAIDDFMVYQQGGNSLLGEKWDDITATLSGITSTIGDIFTFIYEQSAPLFSSLKSGILSLIGGAREGITEALKEFNENAGDGTKSIGENISELISDIGSDIKKGTADARRDFKRAFADVFNEARPQIKNLFSEVIRIFREDLPRVFSGIYNAIEGIAEILMSALPGAIELATSLLSYLSEAVAGIAELIGTIIQDNKEAYGELFNTLFSSLAQIFDALQGAISELLPVLASGLSQIIGAFVPVLTDVIKTVADTLSSVIEYITPLIADAMGLISDAMAKVAPIIGQIINAVVPLVGELIKDVVSVFTQTILPILSQLVEIITTVLQPVIDFAVNTFAPVLETLFGLIRDICNTIIGPIFKDVLASVQMVADLFKTTADYFNDMMRPLFEFFGITSDGLLADAKKIVEVLEPILVPLSTLAKWSDNVFNAGQKTGNWIKGYGFRTNEEVYEEHQGATTKFQNTSAKNAGNAMTAAVNNSINLAGNGLQQALNSSIKVEDLKKLGATTNNDNKRINNTNNNTVNQNITINNSGLSNPLNTATNAAQNILRSMALAPITR